MQRIIPIYKREDIYDYIRKDIVEPLNSWLEQDSEINPKDFYESVIKAAEYNGNLYFLGDGIIPELLVGNHNALKKLYGNNPNGGIYRELDCAELKDGYLKQKQPWHFMYGISRDYFLMDELNRQPQIYYNQHGDINIQEKNLAKLLDFYRVLPEKADDNLTCVGPYIKKHPNSI